MELVGRVIVRDGYGSSAFWGIDARRLRRVEQNRSGYRPECAQAPQPSLLARSNGAVEGAYCSGSLSKEAPSFLLPERGRCRSGKRPREVAMMSHPNFTRLNRWLFPSLVKLWGESRTKHKHKPRLRRFGPGAWVL